VTVQLPVLHLGGPATWLWAKDADVETDLPAGVVVDHGDHKMLVSWVPTGGASASAFTLDSLIPLTVVEPVRCTLCPLQGRIVEGKWLPEESGARG
jgi:hypothetical protein